MSLTPPNLGNYITDAKARQLIYRVFGIVFFIAFLVTVGYASIAHAIPAWLVVTNAVLGAAAVPVLGLASSNTPATPATLVVAGTPTIGAPVVDTRKVGVTTMSNTEAVQPGINGHPLDGDTIPGTIDTGNGEVEPEEAAEEQPPTIDADAAPAAPTTTVVE